MNRYRNESYTPYTPCYTGVYKGSGGGKYLLERSGRGVASLSRVSSADSPIRFGRLGGWQRIEYPVGMNSLSRSLCTR